MTGTLGNTPISVSGGTLSLQNTGAVSQNTITLPAGSSGVLAETASNAISGNTMLQLNGGTANLSQANNYTGITNFNAATLILGNSGALGSTSQVSINGSGTLQASTPLTLPSNIQFNFGQPWTISGANSITVSGPFTQWTTNTTLTSNITGGTLTLAGPVYLSNASTGHNLTIAGAGTTLVSGSIGNYNGTSPVSGGSLTYNGTGLLVLANSNTYTGATTVSGGTVTVAAGGAIGSGGGSAVSVNGGWLNVAGVNGLAVQAVSRSIRARPCSRLQQLHRRDQHQRHVAVAGPQRYRQLLRPGAQQRGRTAAPLQRQRRLQQSPDGIAPSATASINVNNLGGGSGTMTLNGGLSLMNTTSLTAPAQINITGGNSYVLSIPTLTISNSTSPRNSTYLDINPTTASVVLGGVTALTNGGGYDDRLTLDGTSTGNVVTGNLASATGGGYLYLAKAGTGTWTLTGASTYQGSTSITAGILNVQNNNALGSPAGGLTVGNGASLQIQTPNLVYGLTMTISGSGAAGATGALENVSGNNTLASLVILGSNATISSDAGGNLALTNTGSMTGSGYNLTLAGGGRRQHQQQHRHRLGRPDPDRRPLDPHRVEHVYRPDDDLLRRHAGHQRRRRAGQWQLHQHDQQ